MAKCPKCGEILSDQWLKRQGAALMGKSGGKSKARSREQAQEAANARWAKEKAEKEEFARLRTLAGVRPPKAK